MMEVVIDEGIDEPLAGDEEIGRIVVVQGIASGDAMGPAEDRTQADTEADRGPETEPQPPTPTDVPWLLALVSQLPLCHHRRSL